MKPSLQPQGGGTEALKTSSATLTTLCKTIRRTLSMAGPDIHFGPITGMVGSRRDNSDG
jgi:hypothetical protein